MIINRRHLLKAAGATAVMSVLPAKIVQAGTTTHGLSIFGDLKYPAGFAHFNYVEPKAIKGGRLHFSPPNWAYNQDRQSFDTLNCFVFNGSAPPRSELPFDTLMVRAYDEPDAIYGLVAETVEVSDDANTYIFTLRPEARFHDGTPLNAEDVAFSYNLLKEKGHPNLADLLREVTSAEAIDTGVFELVFSGQQTDSAVLEAMTIPILSRVHWEGRDFSASTLEPPLGSGPYRIGRFSAGSFIEYERVADYWGRDLGVNVGLNNADVIRIDFFREPQAEFEALKKGETHIRQEYVSRAWATGYDFPAVTDGRVIKGEFPAETRATMQGWYLNLRRAKFSDPRTREAIGRCFDFEWSNKNLFYGLYSRQQSFFEKSDFAAKGLPSAGELALLEPFRGQIPDNVFGPPVSPPVSDGSGRDRALLKSAGDLLTGAGWTRAANGWVNAAGEALVLEFLIESSVYERILTPYIENLRAVGIAAEMRLAESTQYQNRLQNFDFDIVGRALNISATPAQSLRSIFHSSLADAPGGLNTGGLKHPAVDALVDMAGAAKSRAELTTIVRALDRVLRALQIWVPNWYSSMQRIAYWDRFDRPAIKPEYSFPVEQLWWVNPDKAAKVDKT